MKFIHTADWHIGRKLQQVDLLGDQEFVLNNLIEELKEKGVVFEKDSYCKAPQVFARGSKWVMMRGPDNERIELNERL